MFERSIDTSMFMTNSMVGINAQLDFCDSN